MSEAERGPRGGAANEAGANHRAGVAALLATYGLRGEGARWLASDAAPMEIALEAYTHVDDVVVILADDSRAFIQAKLACGLAGPFRDAVSQWCRSIRDGECHDGDELLLVVAEPRQNLRALAKA